MEKDVGSKENEKIAEIFKSAVSEYASRVASLRGYVLAYWIPSYDNPIDSYMMMKL